MAWTKTWRAAVLLAAALSMIALSGCGKSRAERERDWERVTAKTWYLRSIDGDPVIPESETTIRFALRDSFGGKSGVNDYRGAYNRNDTEQIALSVVLDTDITTNYPPGIMDQEERYLELLLTVDQYFIKGGALQLRSEGDTVLEFVPRWANYGG